MKIEWTYLNDLDMVIQAIENEDIEDALNLLKEIKHDYEQLYHDKKGHVKSSPIKKLE